MAQTPKGGGFDIPAISAPGIAMLVDSTLAIIRANRPLCSPPDDSETELEGRTLPSLMPPEYRDALASRIETIMAAGGGEIEIPLGAQPNSSAWFNVLFTPAPGGGGRFFAVTREVPNFAGLQRKYDLIMSLSHRISSILDLDELLSEVVRSCKETFGFYNVNVGLVEGEEVVIRAGWGGYFGRPDGRYAGETRFDVRGRGIVACVAYSGAPYFAPDVRKDKVFLPFPPLPDVASEGAVPLKVKDRVVGVLDVESDRVNGVTQEDMAVLEALTGPVAVAVENANLYVAVKRAARRYHDLFENAPDIYLTVDAGGQVVDCNRMGAETLKFAKAEIVGRKLESLFLPDSRDSIRGILRAVIDRGEEVRSADAFMVRRGGPALEAALSASPMVEPGERVAGCKVIIKDMTEKALLERQVRQAQKLESLGALAGGIAHDFNNLLGSILGFTSYLKTVVDQKGEVHECLDVIEQTVERGAEITERLQNFARGGEGPKKPVDLEKVIDGTFELLKRTFEKSIALKKDVESPLPPILGDEGQVQQALLNLCLNCRDAMPGGGILRLSAFTAGPESAPRTAAAQATDGWVVVEVKDTGCGIQPQDMDRIFEPFFTTKSTKKGMGLGLSQVYTAMKRMNGAVTVESEPGAGSAFRMFFPASQGAQAEADEPEPGFEARPGADSAGKATILVVDDEKNILKFMSVALRRLGYTTLLASSGAEGLRKIEAWDPGVDLVVLDLMMPEMTGEETLIRMKALRPGLHFVISSAYYSEEKARDLRELGAAAFLQKPYPIEKLAATIETILEAPSCGGATVT